MIKNIFIFTATLALSVSAKADISANIQPDTIYSFGTSCSSSGQWTSKAMQATQTLISTIKSLASDPSCQSLSTLVQALSAQQMALQVQSSIDTSGNIAGESPMQTQNRLTALSNVATSTDPSLKPFAARAGQAYTKEALNNAISAPGMNSRKFEIARGKLFQYASQADSLMASTNALTQLANALPNYQTCLIGRPGPDLGLILASVVGLGAAIASNGNGPAPATSSMVQSILALVHNSKFATAVSSLKQEQFTQSLSCLMEVSTESYCSVLDMQNLIKSPVMNKNLVKAKKDPKVTNPLTGYNILTVHLPNIYQWAQQVQFGVAPRTSADAAFGNDAVQLVAAFDQKIRMLPTMLWDVESQLVGQNSAGRKTTLINGIQRIAGLIDADQSATNFFYQTQNKFVLPFYLLDEANHVPPCVYSSQQSGQPCDVYGMLNTPGQYPRLDNFDNSYLAIVRARLTSLITDSKAKANNYYQARLIPNTTSLAIQSLNSPTNSVKDSFEFVVYYLVYLKGFIQQYGSDDDSMVKMLPAIENATNRFRKILATYDKLDDIQRLNSRSPDYDKLVNEAYGSIVNTVYDQFDMSVQHDGYVVSTLNDFISAEYRLRIKKGIGLGKPYDKEFLISSSQDLLDTIKSAQFTNKIDILTDLSNANVINYKNLEAIDSVFFDSYFNRIQALNQKINCKDLSQGANNRLAHVTASLDVHSNVLDIENPEVMKWCSWGSNAVKTICARIIHADRYVGEHTLDASTQTTCDTANHDFERKRNILCMQSLAFVSRRSRFDSAKSIATNARPEKGLCDGVKMISDYSKDIPQEFKAEYKNLDADYEAILAETQNALAVSNPLEMRQKANDKAICAYRNFRRNNSVYWMTRDLDSRVSSPTMDEIISDRKR